MEQIALLSLATASIAFGIAETKVLTAFRAWARRRNGWFGELVSCGYCLGHWIALALTTIYQPHALSAWWALDIALTTLIIAWLAAFQWALLCRLLEMARK